MDNKKFIEEWLKKNPIIDKDAVVGRKKHSRSLKKKKFDLIIDVHGYIKKEATDLVKNQLKLSHKKGYRKVLIIHGKGLHSLEGPVLKEKIRKILIASIYVSDFHIASPNDGGEGATIVYIRRG